MSSGKLVSDSDWKFLKDIYGILSDGNVLNTNTNEPIVDFTHPNELQSLLDLKVRDEGCSDHNELKKLCESVIKYSLKTGHAHFHNQLFGGVDPLGLAGSWITDALNTSQYTFEVGPVFTLMEAEVIHTFSRLFGFDNGDGIFSPGGSLSNMYGMVLARYRAVPDIKTKGCFGGKQLVAFTSEESHYSIKKASHWLGLGTDNLVAVKCDASGRMRVDDLVGRIEEALREGKQPFFVNAMAATTVAGAFDDLNAIADVCERFALWMHVDACLGGSLIVSKTHRRRLDGISRADSLSWNPHKTLGVPLQCSLFLIKQRGLLHECNSSAAHYLFQQDKFYDVSFDTGDKSVQCGRKVDVLKFWLMLKARGLNGLERLMDNAIQMSDYFTELVRGRDGFRLIQKENFEYTNICFWYIPRALRGERETEEWWERVYAYVALIKEKMIDRGTMMITYCPLPNRKLGNFFRMVVTCFPPATKESMQFILDEIEKLAEENFI